MPNHSSGDQPMLSSRIGLQAIAGGHHQSGRCRANPLTSVDLKVRAAGKNLHSPTVSGASQDERDLTRFSPYEVPLVGGSS